MKKVNLKSVKFLTILVIVFSGELCAQKIVSPKIEFNPKQYICLKTESHINIDGDLHESAWINTEWSENFSDIEGDIEPEPYFRTKVKMLWDHEYFYIAAKMEEKDLIAKLTERDAVVFYDNDFEVFIDPDGDTHNYYELELNLFNTIWDLFLIKPYRDIKNAALNGYDIKGLKSAVQLQGTVNNPTDVDSSWTIEIAIPWESISGLDDSNFPPIAGEYFRVNFSRVEWEYEIINGKYFKKKNGVTGKQLPEHNWVWSPQGIVNMHYPEMWGFVVFADEYMNWEIPEIEKIKWILRKVYYSEYSYFYSAGKFTSKLEELKEFGLKVMENNQLSIESNSSGFKCLFTNEAGEEIAFIREDGYVKIINNK